MSTDGPWLPRRKRGKADGREKEEKEENMMAWTSKPVENDDSRPAKDVHFNNGLIAVVWQDVNADEDEDDRNPYPPHLP